jgi:thermitase
MRLITPVVALTLVAFAMPAGPSAQTPGSGSAVAGQLLVKFRPGASAAAKADVHRVAGGRVANEIARTGVQLVTVPAGDETGAINRYRRNPNVLYAERNFVRSIPTPVSHAPGTEVVAGDHYFRQQWALHNTGQQFYCFPWINGQELCFYVGTNDADIDAPGAWAISTGTPVTVAVIDSGIDFTHPDLTANYGGGINFVAPGSAPTDEHGHGTHVSGTIAAALNNLTGNPAEEEGVVGVAPNARILAYKVCTPDGHCDDFLIQQAIAAAIAAGARVINMSLGGPDYSLSMNDAVQDAWNAGLVIVAGAGNDGNTAPFYPAAYDNVISVGAFDEDHRRASFSNYGSLVDISAPGNVILSSYPMAACVLTTVPGDTGCYTWLSGTSMATPHVSGAAALVWSRADVTSNQQVVDILLNSADPQGVDAVRLDSWTVHGGLNIHNALSFGATTNLPPTASAGPDQTVRDTGGNGVELVALNGSASSDPDGAIVSYEWREGTSVLALVASPSVSLAVGAHPVTLQVTDDNGAELVTLNGSASADTDGSIVGYEWREGTTVVAVGASPSVSLAVGTHTLTLRVTDNDGAASTDSVVVTVNPRPGPTTAHIGDLDGTSAADRSTWTALLTVTVHSTDHLAVAGAVVTGTWSGGATGSATCTTGAAGTCVIVSSSLRKKDGVATFTVTGVTAGGLVYSASQNHDPDGGSTGTAVSIVKP